MSAVEKKQNLQSLMLEVDRQKAEIREDEEREQNRQKAKREREKADEEKAQRAREEQGRLHATKASATPSIGSSRMMTMITQQQRDFGKGGDCVNADMHCVWEKSGEERPRKTLKRSHEEANSEVVQVLWVIVRELQGLRKDVRGVTRRNEGEGK
jgi:hypothetical protein